MRAHLESILDGVEREFASLEMNLQSIKDENAKKADLLIQADTHIQNLMEELGKAGREIKNLRNFIPHPEIVGIAQVDVPSAEQLVRVMEYLRYVSGLAQTYYPQPTQSQSVPVQSDLP
jgi:hypothetical protein